MYYASDYATLPNWQKAVIDAAIADGARWAVTGSTARLDSEGETEYAQVLVTREMDIPDCTGRFVIGFADGNVYYYYEHASEPACSMTFSCGILPEDYYDIDAMIDKANTCPKCHDYVGIDNMYPVGKNGRACKACAQRMRGY